MGQRNGDFRGDSSGIKGIEFSEKSSIIIFNQVKYSALGFPCGKC